MSTCSSHKINAYVYRTGNEINALILHNALIGSHHSLLTFAFITGFIHKLCYACHFTENSRREREREKERERLKFRRVESIVSSILSTD